MADGIPNVELIGVAKIGRAYLRRPRVCPDEMSSSPRRRRSARSIPNAYEARASSCGSLCRAQVTFRRAISHHIYRGA